ncbi:helix-turn-helix domain-containing protein [Hymenobacter sp. B81]|uniref:helix-turn-helix domain-containing protein n=1 Tax=Hymenobacter sp. B81 TaxID=3344878 RepID=UPI0037DC3A5B
MARALTLALPSNTLEAAIRAHFGLAQAELARYLGVSASLVAKVEAGRRRPSRPVEQRLTRLGDLLPPPTGQGPVAPRFAAAPLPPPPVVELPDFGAALPLAPLRWRQAQVLAQASRLRWQLHQAGKGAALQQRREWGLAQLQAALGPAALPDPAEQAHVGRWLAVLAADVQAAAPTPAARAAQALAVLRLLTLDAEAAALAPLVAAAGG